VGDTLGLGVGLSDGLGLAEGLTVGDTEGLGDDADGANASRQVRSHVRWALVSGRAVSASRETHAR